MLCLVTVLQRDFGVFAIQKLNHYPDCSNSEDLFLHGILRGHGGTCSSLPVLYASVGRRLGYPLKLARAAYHLFARWDDPGGDRFNIECTALGLEIPPDEFYSTWPAIPDPEDARAGYVFKSMAPREELAGFLVQRAYCLLHNNRHQAAVESCIGATMAAPGNKCHEQSTVLMMRHWQARLRQLHPPGFPKLFIHPPARRRFPSRLPFQLEQDFLTFQVMEELLNDSEKQRRWWQPLLQSSQQWPTEIPTCIEISVNQDYLFGLERSPS